jgi:hypothetical protein
VGDTNLVKYVRKLEGPEPEWLVVPDDYVVDAETCTALRALGVTHIMRLWQMMDETFRSWDQATRVMDEDDAPQVDEIEPRSPRGVFEQYIPQSYRGDMQGNDCLDLCLTLRPAADGVLLMVLGQAGYGKTWLTKAYNFAAARRYLQSTSHDITDPDSLSGPPPPIPFVIPFGEYRKLASVGAIVRERLEAVGVPEYTTPAFQHLLTRGRIVLVLDGFDELLESSPFHARENLKEIQQAVHGRGIMVLTSRTTLFRNQRDVESFLGTDRPTALQLAVVTLDAFDATRRGQFLKSRGASSKEIEQISRVSMGDLSGGPQTLSFMLKIVREGVSPTETRTRADVFEKYANHVFDRERTRQGFDIPDMQQTVFLEDIAFEILSEDVGVITKDLVELATPSDVSVDDQSKLTGHYFLQPDREGVGLTFEHHLVRDFFAAQAIRRRLESHGPERAFDVKLTEGAAGFLGELLGDGDLTELLRSTESNARAYRNLMMVALDRIEREESTSTVSQDEMARRAKRLSDLIGGTSLSRRDLGGLEFSLYDFTGWSFTDSRARDARFSSCDLRGASGVESLADATLQDCLLQKVHDLSAEERAKEQLRRFMSLFARSGNAFSFATSELYERDTKEKRKSYWDEEVASSLTALGFAHKERAKKSQLKLVLDREKELREFYFKGQTEGVQALLRRLAE